MFLKFLKKLFFAQVAFSVLVDPKEIVAASHAARIPTATFVIRSPDPYCVELGRHYTEVCSLLTHWEVSCENSFLEAQHDNRRSGNALGYLLNLSRKLKADEYKLQELTDRRNMLANRLNVQNCNTHKITPCSSPLDPDYRKEPGSCLNYVEKLDYSFHRVKRYGYQEQDVQQLAANIQINTKKPAFKKYP